jgi:hypothetical protein
VRHSTTPAPEPATLFCGACRRWIESDEPPQVLGPHTIWLCPECRPEGKANGYAGAAERSDGAKLFPNTKIATTPNRLPRFTRSRGLLSRVSHRWQPRQVACDSAAGRQQERVAGRGGGIGSRGRRGDEASAIDITAHAA